jgi:hypothetical protein
LWAPHALMVAVIAVNDVLPSPLSELLPEQVSPELLHLQVKLAAQLPYRQAAALLDELLPETGGLNHATTRSRTLAVGKCIDPSRNMEPIQTMLAFLPKPGAYHPSQSIFAIRQDSQIRVLSSTAAPENGCTRLFAYGSRSRTTANASPPRCEASTRPVRISN